MRLIEEQSASGDTAGVQLGQRVHVRFHKMRSALKARRDAQLAVPPETVLGILRIHPKHTLCQTSVHERQRSQVGIVVRRPEPTDVAPGFDPTVEYERPRPIMFPQGVERRLVKEREIAVHRLRCQRRADAIVPMSTAIA